MNYVIPTIWLAVWVGFAIFGFKKKWSGVISIGGGFFTACAALVLGFVIHDSMTGGKVYFNDSSSKVAQSHLSKEIIATLEEGDKKKTRTFSTDYLTVIYSPDPFDESGECQININYFNGKEVVSDAHPRTRMFYKSSQKEVYIAIPNSISNTGGTIRVKGNSSDDIVNIDNSAHFGGQLGRIQVALKDSSEFEDLLEIMLSSSKITVDSGEFLGQRRLITFKMNGFSDAYSATQFLCSH